MNRATDSISKVPLFTLFQTCLMCVIFFTQVIFEPNIHAYTMNPRQVIYLHEYYRFVTSSLSHRNFFHILVNMMSYVALGSSLEKQFGSLWHFFTVSWSILLTSTLYIILSFLLYFLLGIQSLMYGHSVGFSGVLFHLCVIQAYRHPNATRSLFGFFSVSSTVYPWVLLIALQIIIPNVSFLGHLSGILVGTLQVYGLLDILLPSHEYRIQCDQMDFIRPATSQPNYIKTPIDDPNSVTGRSINDLRHALVRGCESTRRFLQHLLETIKVIIFGSERRENGHEYAPFMDEEMNVVGNNSSGVSRPSNFDNDEWSGLPSRPEFR